MQVCVEYIWFEFRDLMTPPLWLSFNERKKSIKYIDERCVMSKITVVPFPFVCRYLSHVFFVSSSSEHTTDSLACEVWFGSWTKVSFADCNVVIIIIGE